ncbi:hypothetical protein ASPZODRAFT_63290 [Penicilliopsis zonata CBS 506.65]|uniref:Zn(2)-C6 fungal-type domain-containing protein n=1 Tax=Penicilliopsis zonata CBS 506.65 TaxID=1073090 RepID=A0A1L9SKD8_9EURO|nr:hypothetical protein ASPZODRAFT_63290 [Penicilliopsis zonata CBS 506.65]OJJ47702.1 hypothetical protein ASPZODRAFT_63290 [Penicilliopsis zonata CBS 506.65]
MSAAPHALHGPDSGPPPPPAQLNRSCESCRGLKVRCLPDPTSATQCQRCVKARRACIFLAPQKRRPRRRTDSRVAQLEKEMRVMRSLLKGRLPIQDATSPESSSSVRDDSLDNDPTTTDSPERLSNVPESEAEGNADAPNSSTGSIRHIDCLPGFAPSAPSTLEGIPLPPVPPANAGMPENAQETLQEDDVIDKGILSITSADELIEFFRNELAHFFPLVVLPPGTTAYQLRRSKPLLFLSVIAAAAIAVDGELARTLNREMIRLYAEKFFIEGEKSLELVQALLVMTVFYFPADSGMRLQFYQYTHIASTMALEIGLASKRKVVKKAYSDTEFDEHMAEQARAILGCYHLASTVAMRTRRPNFLLFNDWMGECVKHLERSPTTIDRHMARWFELQRITDETLMSFGLDDTSSTVMAFESRIQAVLRWFDNRMQSWKRDLPPDMLTVPMLLGYHYALLAVYELAAGEGYRDPDAVKRKFYTLPPPDEAETDRQPAAPLSAMHVDITTKFMNASQQMMDTFLGCDTDTMRKLPNLMYTRVVQAITSLLKIYYSVRTGALGEVISPQTVNVEMYLDAMSKRLTEASDGHKYKIPSRWWYIVAVKSRDWYERFQRQHQRDPVTAFNSFANGNGSVAPPSSSTSPPTPQNPLPARIRSPLSFEPMGPSSSASSRINLPSPIPSSSSYGGSNIALSTPTTWPMDSANNIDPTTGYPALPPMPQHYAYDTPKLSHENACFVPPGSAGTDMELDGWVSDGNIFGMPSLPGFSFT